jgi:hypothetical protein
MCLAFVGGNFKSSEMELGPRPDWSSAASATAAALVKAGKAIEGPIF